MYQLLCIMGIIHEGIIVTVQVEMMYRYELKVSEISARDHYYIAQVHKLTL